MEINKYSYMHLVEHKVEHFSGNYDFRYMYNAWSHNQFLRYETNKNGKRHRVSKSQIYFSR